MFVIPKSNGRSSYTKPEDELILTSLANGDSVKTISATLAKKGFNRTAAGLTVRIKKWRENAVKINGDVIVDTSLVDYETGKFLSGDAQKKAVAALKKAYAKSDK